MTYITYAVGARASTVYTATANGTALPLWGRTTDAHFTSPYWSAGQMVPQSWATIASDQTLTIVVSMVSGSVSSARVYANDPSGATIPVTVSGGTATFSLPADTAAWCEINGNRGQPLLIHSKPILTQPTGGTVDIYNGTQTSATAGRTLVFPPGVHTIGQSFQIPAGSAIWLHGEAWVIGSLQLVNNAGGHSIGGHGVLSGEWGQSIRAWIRTLPFETASTYSMLHGPYAAIANSTVSGITFVDPPFYTTRYGANVYDRVTVIAPWWGNSNAFFPAQKWPELTANVNKCNAYVHDDVFDLAEYLGPHTFTDCIVGSVASASILVSYWPSRNSGTRHVATNNTIVCLNYATSTAGSIVLVWSDGGSPQGGDDTATDESFHVVSGITMDGARFMGSTINGIVFDFRNRIYPSEWGGTQGAATGQIRDIVIRNVTVETVPTFRSKLLGLDYVNTPHDIVFENVWFGATRLTAANFDTFFERNEFPFNIYVDGVPVADFWTTTGSWYQSSPVVDPWSYLPATGRIGGARALQLPRNAVWPGTSTPSRGALPSIGGYDWGEDTGATSAVLSVTIAPTLSIAGASSIAASLAATATPTLSIVGGPAIDAQLSASLGPTVAIVGAPIVAAILSATVTPTHTLAGGSSVDGSLSADAGPAFSLAGGPIVEASAAADIGPAFALEAGATVEAILSATVEPSVEIVGETITPGETVATLSASIAPEFVLEGGPVVDATADASVAVEAELVGEAVTVAVLDAVVDATVAIAGSLETWPDLTAALSATITPTYELAGEVETVGSLAATITPEFDLVAELGGTYDARTSDLVAIRSALMGMLGRSAATNGATVTYEAEPQGAPWPATATILRPVMLPVTRTLVGFEGEPLVQQDGRLQIQVLFPRGTGILAMMLRLSAIRARYPAQTVVASVGVTLTGAAEVRRIGVQDGRVRWDVTIPWRSVRQETGAADTQRLTGSLQTMEGALEAVRTVWRDRIETARPSEGWAGLRTFYDDVGPFVTPPAVPWAGVWTDAVGASSREASTPTEIILGQTMVQIHADKSLGTAGTDRILERITAEHNRTFRSVHLGVVTLSGSRVSTAGTWQTTLRIPFRFERLRQP